jgi:hypothetical protein
MLTNLLQLLSVFVIILVYGAVLYRNAHLEADAKVRRDEFMEIDKKLQNIRQDIWDLAKIIQKIKNDK